jgi:acyl-CoA synthetase (AMP-forming)/AMP-acid ligase II
MNLADLLGATAARLPGQPAVTDVRSGKTLSYGELAVEADRVAAFLRAQGVRPGQRIGLVAPNAPAHLAAAFGLLRAGACLVPLATGLTPSETTEVVRQVDVNACLAWPGATPPGSSGEFVRLSGGVCAGFGFRWLDRDVEGPPGFRGLDPAFVRFTSGTTADAKGVVLSHRDTLARVEAADRVLRFTAADRILWILPLAYHFAAHVLLCPDTLPGTVLSAILRREATVVYASPLHFERLANLRPVGRLESLRLALSTSAPLARPVAERFQAAHGVALCQAYGIIEAGLPCINLPADGVSPTSVGRVTPGYELAIVGERGAWLPPGETGEIALRGDGLFSAYYAPWQPRAQVMRDGWFLTGDLGHMDAEGAVHLEGRKKSVIFVGGLKFFPEEVEACINGFPGVKESRVFGRPHARLGEVPRAEIVLASPSCDLDALRRHCARLLSSYKVPFEFSVVPAIPRTAGGKILRRSPSIAQPALAGEGR